MGAVAAFIRGFWVALGAFFVGSIPIFYAFLSRTGIFVGSFFVTDGAFRFLVSDFADRTIGSLGLSSYSGIINFIALSSIDLLISTIISCYVTILTIKAARYFLSGPSSAITRD